MIESTVFAFNWNLFVFRTNFKNNSHKDNNMNNHKVYDNGETSKYAS